MVRSEHTTKKELDDAEELMQPVFVPFKSGSERTFENSIIEGNVENTENTENVESSECTIKREFDDADALMSPIFVPPETESVFQGKSEDPILHVEYENTQNTVAENMDSGEFEMKKNITDAETSMASSFVHIKAEFEKTSSEKVEEDSQASKMTEVCISQASILVKEEPIDWEETWQNSIKLEPTSPPSTNTQNEVSDKSSEDGVNKKDIFEEIKWQRPLSDSPLHFRSQFVSSTQCLSEMEVRDTQKNFKRSSFSSSSTSVWLPSFECQNVLPTASCSTDDFTAGQEKAVDTHLCKKPADQQIAPERQKQQSSQFGDRISTKLEETHSQREMLQCGSLGSSNGEGFFKCGHCGKDFKRKYDLPKHMRIHTGDRPYKCSKCGKSFTQNGHLTGHMRGHTGERPYKCSQCGKSFNRSNSLTSHMRTHTGDKPYKCLQCGKSFVKSSILTRHMRKHTGDRPYKCSQCGKSFLQNSDLTRHVRKHTGDRPYKCSHCGKSFVQSSHLTRHIRKHSRE